MGLSFSLVTAKFRNKAHINLPRDVIIGRSDLYSTWCPKNVIWNQNYNILTFIPLVLLKQFSTFFNLYFLVTACIQFVPMFRVSHLYTYWAPLAFVTFVTMLREAYEDIKRALRDKELNSQKYKVITETGQQEVKSWDVRVSDIVLLNKNQRVPADLLLLQTVEKSGK